MLLYKDLVTGDELFTDNYKPKPFEDEFLLGIRAKQETRTASGISAALLGGNPSQEEVADECDDPTVQRGLDVALDHNLTDQSDYFTSKKILQSYLKKWVKNVVGKLAEESKEKANEFKTLCTPEKFKAFCEKWNPDCSVYSGDSFDPVDATCCLLIGVWDDDGMSITLYGIKHCMIQEKL